jgi:hypothetical protein
MDRILDTKGVDNGYLEGQDNNLGFKQMSCENGR